MIINQFTRLFHTIPHLYVVLNGNSTTNTTYVAPSIALAVTLRTAYATEPPRKMADVDLAPICDL